MAVTTVVENQKLDVNSDMKVGDRVRVTESVVMYHHPEHRGEAFDLKGLEGEVINIATEWQGRPVSANFPIQVKFTKKFKAHLRTTELEKI
ncbi:MAG: ferredoxin-thioredoxin reductase variable chain [Rivularia sp. (in: cyanobacteria)]